MQTAQIRARKPLADGAGHKLRAPLAVWLSMIAVVGLASRPTFPGPPHRARDGCKLPCSDAAVKKSSATRCADGVPISLERS